MGTVLGIAQSWWSVAGLAIDIIGVSILAIEVWRGAEGPSGFFRKADDPTATGIRNMGPPTEYRDIPKLAKKGMPSDVRKAFEALDSWFDDQDFMGRVEGYNRQLETNVVPGRRRKFVIAGAALLVLGFFLQIIGAWPL